ncbi:MAG TPA: hypothetical protein VN845_02850 [Solirubrobacteraceae bacterium]|nr:hypothetical protein [Solirubrobacteraceae bacterium]
MGGEFAGAGLEGFGLLAEDGDAWSAGVLGHAAGLERVEVAVHCCASVGELALCGCELVLLVFLALGEPLVCLGNRTVE